MMENSSRFSKKQHKLPIRSRRRCPFQHYTDADSKQVLKSSSLVCPLRRKIDTRRLSVRFIEIQLKYFSLLANPYVQEGR